MKLLLRLAARNLRRHFRRSLLTLGSISFGLAILLLLQCILEGRNQNVINRITSTYTGQLQIFPRTYLEDHAPTEQMKEDPSLWKNVLPEGSIIGARLHFPGMLSSADQSVPILLEGIEPEKEIQITEVGHQVKEGQFLESDPDADCPSRQIFIGNRLANLLQVHVGSKVVFMGQAMDGTLGNDLFRVKGIFDTGSPDFDKRFVYAPLTCVQKIGLFKGVHEAAVHLPDPSADLLVQRSTQAKLPADLEVTTWREAMPMISSVIKLNDATLVLISSALFAVIILGVINTLLMNLFERTKEFGVMMALGVTPRKLRLLIMTECFLMAVIASVVGTLIGAVGVIYYQKTGFDLRPFLGDVSYFGSFHLDLVIHPIFLWLPFLKMLFTTILVVLLAGLYPAYRASCLDPVETMRG
jgi:ABC-type lipoprotein release transport system permease subunit